MTTKPKENRSERTACLLAVNVVILLSFCNPALLSGKSPQTSETSESQSGQEAQVTIPRKPDAPLYKGEQGAQSSEVEFSPSTRKVTIKFRVQDPNGYFLPNIRPENFAVYEDGVPQKNVNVEIEHSPISVALLMELGGRYHELNRVLEQEVPRAGRELLNVIGPDDKVAVFKYDSKLETLVDFNQGHEVLDHIFDHMTAPNFSETNFYDALLEALSRTKDVHGRNAIILISSGVDTFSKANYQQVLESAKDSATPIYAISLAPALKLEAAVYGNAAPFARIDWAGAEQRLETLAKASGGRAYTIDSSAALPGIYDDIMENLRVRYVVTYVSSNPATSGPPRNIRVELIDPTTGKPLKIHDSEGKVISARVLVQQTYNPGKQ